MNHIVFEGTLPAHPSTKSRSLKRTNTVTNMIFLWETLYSYSFPFSAVEDKFSNLNVDDWRKPETVNVMVLYVSKNYHLTKFFFSLAGPRAERLI